MNHGVSTRLVTVLALALGVIPAMPSCKRQASPRRSDSASNATPAHPSAPARADSLRDADLIFQESTSRQSEMVRALTRSRWTHLGVLFSENGHFFVFEATSPVSRTPLAAWIVRGRGQRYVVKRLRDANARLTPVATQRMKSLGSSWLGRPYDSLFRWDDASLYCSELVHKLFDRTLDVQLGQVQRANEMNLDDPLVQAALRIRFAGTEFNRNEPVITPDSIFSDPQLIEVPQ